MKNDTENKSDKAALWDGMGVGIIILSICLGIGGCNYMIAKGQALLDQSNETHQRTSE